MQRARSRARGFVIAIVGAALTIGALPAVAGVVGDGTTLIGKGPTRWEINNDTSSCNTSSPSFSPVDDGKFQSKSDAFDGGLIASVDGTDFVDADSEFPLLGQDPVTLVASGGVGGGIRVTRWETALAGSPTLRSLVGIRNTNDTASNLTVQWDSDLGSDGGEAVRADSSGNGTFGSGDRWVVSSDDATSPSDPVLTFALFGRRAAERTASIVDTFGSGCFGVTFDIRVAAKSTRYLLFFTQMSGTNDGAIARASAFNRPAASLLAGVSARVRNRVLNWNL